MDNLYKYISAEWLKEDLLGDKEQLYFASRKELNDPFELVGEIKVVSSSIWHVAAKDVQNFLNKLSEGVKDKIGVFCCSAVCDDITMWGYYADGHKGCCLELDQTADPDFFHGIKAVSYNNVRPSAAYDPSKPVGVPINDFLFHKASCWVHEKEYRIVRLTLMDYLISSLKL